MSDTAEVTGLYVTIQGAVLGPFETEEMRQAVMAMLAKYAGKSQPCAINHVRLPKENQLNFLTGMGVVTNPRV